MSRSSLFPSGAVFTVEFTFGPLHKVFLGRDNKPENDPSFDLAIIEFSDDGSFVDIRQKEAALNVIASARQSNRNGAIVVVFIHGWHHSARWNPTDGSGDSHFEGFRKVLMSLALREAERRRPNASTAGRRVVGVYLAWQGDPATWPSKVHETWLTHLSFLNRYRTAERIGGSDAMRTTVREIVSCAKGLGPPNVPNHASSPLVLIGHSMGSLILESTLLRLLRDRHVELASALTPDPSSCVEVTCAGQPVSFPDVMIALNSAANSRITKEIIGQLKLRQLSKRVRADQISYSPPLFLSATSTADWATKLAWRLVPSNFFSRTGGHDSSLFTHTFDNLKQHVACIPKPGTFDFGQNWSCLRLPHPFGIPTPAVPIDLPERDRSDQGGASHVRYQLTPISGREHETHLAWVFQLPPRISAEHNDIFNPRASLLMLALMQISGAVMSLANEWKDNFEPVSQ